MDILIVEDSPADERLIREALTKEDCESVHSVKDGKEALGFVRKEDGYDSAPRPDLILLDLNLPRVDGYDVLEGIKNDPELHRIPIVVFSSSDDPRDIEHSYELDANAYITKPGDLPSYMRAIHEMEEYWLGVAHLPGQTGASQRQSAGSDGGGA